MALDFPNSPTVGQLFPSPPVVGTPVWRWDGTEWVSTGSVGSSAIIYIQDTAPVGAAQNSLWWNSSNGQLYIYYNDGTSTQWVFAALGNITPVVRNYLTGLILSTAGSSATFSVSPGVAADSTNVDMLNLSVSLSKTTAAWTVGAAGGGLDTGALTINTWYHVYLIKRPDTQAVDLCFSLSAVNPTLGGGGYIPSNYILFRRIGAMRTNASSQWTGFTQLGDEFLWLTPVLDVNITNPGLAAVIRTLTVPTGVQITARYAVQAVSTDTPPGSVEFYFSSLDQSDASPSGLIADSFDIAYGGIAGGELYTRTNLSGQVRSRVSVSTPNVALRMLTEGWIDTRGRYA